MLAGWTYSLILTCALLILPVAAQFEIESRLCVMTSKIFPTSFSLMSMGYIVPVGVIISLYGMILWRTVGTTLTHPNATVWQNISRNVVVFQNILLLLAIVLLGYHFSFLWSSIVLLNLHGHCMSYRFSSWRCRLWSNLLRFSSSTKKWKQSSTVGWAWAQQLNLTPSQLDRNRKFCHFRIAFTVFKPFLVIKI